MRIPDERVGELLESWPVARLATLRPDGAPHQVPIVFARCDAKLWSPIDGKPKRDALPRRIENLRRDPRASLLLDHYDADWQRLWWLRLDVEARLRQTDAAALDLSRALDALRAKYPQYRDTALLTDLGLVIELHIVRVASWCPGPHALQDAR